MENTEIEEKIKNKFIETYSKQMRITRWIFLLLFGIFGLFFLIAGIICTSLNIVDTDGFPMGILFIIFGVLFITLGTVLFFLASNKKLYNNMFEQSQKRGIKNTIILSAIIDIQAEQIKELNERIESLERKLK